MRRHPLDELARRAGPPSRLHGGLRGNFHALVGLVRSLGYDARGFASAEDFLASIDLGQFAGAITDIQMPGMNGFELKRELSMRHRSLPVIMITARAEPGIEEKAMSSGATCFLLKPFEAQTLVSYLQRILSV